ncbi:MAG: ribulose-phosphate 3-epimerase, partial [Clostridia bacterium]|nr:ribulose-phosphate 3-epimerase [Clostridia bacterium]
TVHFEACKNIEETLKKIKAKNVVSGVAINPKTPALKLKDLLDTGLVDVVTVMSVQPGACGQKFIPGSAEKVAEIRELNKKVFIEIDGGVNTKNAPILRKLGANIIVSGSTIFSSKNIKKTIKQLKGKGLANRLRDYF